MAVRTLWNSNDPDDPLTRALQPPFDESPEERMARIRQQEEAQRVSKEIDDEIALARKAYERRKRAIKILLLGAYSDASFLPNTPPTLRPQARRSRARALPSRVSIRASLFPVSRSPSQRLSATVLPTTFRQGACCLEDNYPAQPHPVCILVTPPRSIPLVSSCHAPAQRDICAFLWTFV